MQVSLRQVGAALPAATHDLFLHTRPIAAGARPEHPPGGVPPGLVFGLPLRNGLRHVALHPHADGVDVVRLVVGRHGGHGLHGGVEQVDEGGEGVAEKAGDAQRHVHARPVAHGHGQHLDVGHPVAARHPLGPHPHQGQGLGHVFAPGAHGAGAPHRQAHRCGKAAVVLQVPLDHAVGRLRTHVVGSRRGHGTRVHRIEVAPGGQHVGPPARRCATGAGRHETARQPVEQAAHFQRATGIDPGGQHALHVSQHGQGAAPIWRGRGGAVNQGLGQVFQPLAGVALVAPRGVTRRQQRGGAWAGPGAGPIAIAQTLAGVEGVEITQPQVVCQGLQQAALPRGRAAGKAGQRQQRIAALAALGRLAEAVQPVADLRLFQLAQVGIQPFQQRLALGVVGRWGKAQVFVQAVLQHVGQDVLAQPLGAPGVERQGLDVLVHLAFQLQQRAVGFGAGERGHQVVDDDGLRAPLGLAALAGVVDDEGVQVRQRPQQQVGPAIGPQGHAFAGQPFQVAVLAHVHQRIHLEHPAQPEIERQVGVGRHQVGVVVAGHAVQVAPARGLYAHEHLAQPQAGDHEAARAHHGVGLGRAPQPAHRLLVGGGQRRKVAQVVGHGQALAHGTVVVVLKVVGDVAQQQGHEGIAVGGQRRRLAGVPALRVQRVQDVHRGGRGVQPHAVGQAGVVVGVVGQHQGHALVRHGLAAQHAPAPGQLGHPGDALGLGLVAHHVGLRALAAPGQAFEADGAGQDAAIHLGQHHLHGQVARGEAVGVLLPLRLVAPGGDELQHRRIARPVAVPAVFSQVGIWPACPTFTGRGHGKRGGIEHHVHPLPAHHRSQFGQAVGVFERVHAVGQRAHTPLGQGVHERIEHRRVARLHVGAVEQQQRNRHRDS